MGLQECLPKHKCGLYIEHNPQKDMYQTVALYLREREGLWPFEWVSDTAEQECIDANELWTLQWYPDTPIGFHALAGPSLDLILKYVNKTYLRG